MDKQKEKKHEAIGGTEGRRGGGKQKKDQEELDKQEVGKKGGDSEYYLKVIFDTQYKQIYLYYNLRRAVR